MKIKYVPCGQDSPDHTSAYGYDFELNGPAVDVTDATAIKKLSKNPHFKVVGEKAEKMVAVKTGSEGEGTGGGGGEGGENHPSGPSMKEMKAALKDAGVNVIGMTNADVEAKFKALPVKETVN